MKRGTWLFPAVSVAAAVWRLSAATTLVETWDTNPPGNHNWKYWGGAETDAPWHAAGGDNDSGCIGAALAQLQFVQNGFWPFYINHTLTTDPSQHITLKAITRIEATFRLADAGAAPGDLACRHVAFFIGEYLDVDQDGQPESETFYFRDVLMDPGHARSRFRFFVGEPTGWRMLYHNPATPLKSLAELLDDPQQYGFCLINRDNLPAGGEPPLPQGELLLDSLTIAESGPVPTVWIVDVQQRPGYHFTHIQEAIDSPLVLSGVTLHIRDGNYAERPTTKGSGKVLTFEGEPGTVLLWPGAPGPDAHYRHLWLEFGGEVRRIVFRGPGRQYSNCSGLGITGPTMVTECEFSDYARGFLGFCAANAVDEPSRVERNLFHDNELAVSNGDMEHIYAYNIVRHNGQGFDLATGSLARLLNNLIVSNATHGIRLVGYMTNWPGTAEIANNTIAYNGQHAIYLEWTPGTNLQASLPICPVIKNNILAFNGGYAIEANTLYGAIVLGPSGADPTVGGCYPQIRHNVIYGNQNLKEPKDCVLNQFWSELTPGGAGGVGRRCYHVPDPLSYGGRQPNNRYEDPRLLEGWWLAGGSPCIDHGDATLRPGATQQTVSQPWQSPKPVLDCGRIDIGYHHPLTLADSPQLSISKVPGLLGDDVAILARGLDGDVVQLSQRTSVSPGSGLPWEPLVTVELPQVSPFVHHVEPGSVMWFVAQ